MTEPAQRSRGYLWFDAEFSSLDLDTALLLQVSLVITGPDLVRILPSSRDLNLFLRLEAGDPVSPWVEKHIPHILRRCREPGAVTLPEAEGLLCAAVTDAFGDLSAAGIATRPLLAGNSVHNDWAMARRLLPRFQALTHYRLLDVSTLKTQWVDAFGGTAPRKDEAGFVRRYCPGAVLAPGQAEHDAYFDVQASIAELAWYRSMLTPPAAAGPDLPG
ncbi:MAG: hypothetical protein U1F77_04385 [Kiritimatiellia bacterium]